MFSLKLSLHSKFTHYVDEYADTRIEIHALICKKFKISPDKVELITIIRAIVEKKKQKPGWTSRNNKWRIMEEK